MTDTAALLKKLQVKDSGVLLIPGADALPLEIAEATADRVKSENALDPSDLAILDARDRATFTELFDANRDLLAPLRVVWLIYPKGNASDINRDSIWEMLIERTWRPVSQVAVNDTHSAIRVRPLKDGEEASLPAKK